MGKIIVATPQNPVSYISPSNLFPLVFCVHTGISISNSFVIKKEFELSESSMTAVIRVAILRIT
jgi:hypothetical protein